MALSFLGRKDPGRRLIRQVTQTTEKAVSTRLGSDSGTTSKAQVQEPIVWLPRAKNKPHSNLPQRRLPISQTLSKARIIKFKYRF